MNLRYSDLEKIKHVSDFLAYDKISYICFSNYLDQLLDLSDDQILSLIYKNLGNWDIFEIARFLSFSRKSVVIKIEREYLNSFSLMRHIVARKTTPETYDIFNYVFDLDIRPHMLKYPRDNFLCDIIQSINCETDTRIIDTLQDLNKTICSPKDEHNALSELVANIVSKKQTCSNEKIMSILKYLIEEKNANVLPFSLRYFRLDDAEDIFSYLLSNPMVDIKYIHETINNISQTQPLDEKYMTILEKKYVALPWNICL